MNIKFEVVDCPKCDGKMVPLSSSIYEKTGSYKIVLFAEWRCVKCGYRVKSNE